MAPITPAARAGHPRAGQIVLEVNSEQRQKGDLAAMIWSVDEIVATLSGFDRLLPGDLIFTGTPAGVGPVRGGDHLRGAIEGLAPLEVRITPAG